MKDTNYDLLRTLRLNGTTLRLWDTNRLTGGAFGKAILKYQFKVGRKVIFEGEDFSPSPCWAIDSLQTAYSCLSFLTLKPGDTDSEYFEKYSEDQMNWAKSSKCEYLSYLVSDWEEKNHSN